MRDLHPDILAHYNARKGVSKGLLIWVNGRNRATNAIESFGFWTGQDTFDATINGAPRRYYGQGALIQIPPLVSEIGLRDRATRITLSHLHPRVISAVRGYDPRGRVAELHVVDFRKSGGTMIGEPTRVGYTQISGLRITDAAAGGEGSCELTLRTRAAFLTRILPLRKSDEAQRARHPGDGIRRYIATSGTAEINWGTVKKST